MMTKYRSVYERGLTIVTLGKFLCREEPQNIGYLGGLLRDYVSSGPGCFDKGPLLRFNSHDVKIVNSVS